MKFCLSVLLFLFFSPVIIAQQYEQLIRDGNTLDLQLNEKAALEKFKQAVVLRPNDVYALSKCSELFSRIGARFSDESLRDNYYATAMAYAEKALIISPASDMANVSMAIALGKSSLTKSGKDKIKYAKRIKVCIETALKTNPNNYVAWHILARWEYEVTNISSFERMAAKVFYGAVPQGSFANAIMYFEKAKTLNPKFILNYLEMAKAYHKNDNDKKAIEYLQLILKLPTATQDDPLYKKQATELIKKWS